MKTEADRNSPAADAGARGVFAPEAPVVFRASGCLLVCFAITPDPLRVFPSGSFCGSEPTLTNVLRDLVKAEVTEPISAKQPSADWASALETRLHSPWLGFGLSHCCGVRSSLNDMILNKTCPGAGNACWPSSLSVRSIYKSFCQMETMKTSGNLLCAFPREERARHLNEVSLANTSLWGRDWALKTSICN